MSLSSTSLRAFTKLRIISGVALPASALAPVGSSAMTLSPALGALPSGSAAAQHPRHANLSAIRLRMKSIQSIGKITKAMKMVAAAKLRTVQGLREQAKPFATTVSEFFSILDDAPSAPAGTGEEGAVVGKTMLLPLSSDRGLCGGVNNNVVKEVKRSSATMDPTFVLGQSNPPFDLVLVGDKARDALTRVLGKGIVLSFKDVFRAPVSFSQVCVIAEDVLQLKPGNLIVVYNKFKSVISQEVTQGKVHGLDKMMFNAALFDEYEFESDLDSQQVFLDLYEFQLAAQLFGACLENSTSEQAARMSAMDNASRNSADMLSRLTLSYNRQRQSVITSELIEIISGAEALKEAK